MKTFHLKWSSHPSNMETVFATLLDSEGLSDVTLICGGEAPNSKKNEQHHLRAHRLLLSTCSNFFLVCPDAPFLFFSIMLSNNPFSLFAAFLDVASLSFPSFVFSASSSMSTQSCAQSPSRTCGGAR